MCDYVYFFFQVLLYYYSGVYVYLATRAYTEAKQQKVCSRSNTQRRNRRHNWIITVNKKVTSNQTRITVHNTIFNRCVTFEDVVK